MDMEKVGKVVKFEGKLYVRDYAGNWSNFNPGLVCPEGAAKKLEVEYKVQIGGGE